MEEGAAAGAGAGDDDVARTDYFEIMKEALAPVSSASHPPLASHSCCCFEGEEAQSAPTSNNQSTTTCRGTATATAQGVTSPPARIKLGAAYNAFDGEELLEASIRSLRAGGVDFVCVVYQTTSNFGSACSERLVPLIERLQRSGMVDVALLYEPRRFHSALERRRLVSTRAMADSLGTDLSNLGDQFLNEVSKREAGRQECAKAGCTHFMSVDCDEFYVASQLQWAKKLMATSKYEGVFCRMRHYYKNPRWQLEPQDMDNYVPAIYKIASWMPLKLAHPYPVTVDPTRTAEHLRFLKLADASELEMHHMSLVRDFPRGIIAKLDNVSNKANYFATSTTDRAEGVRTFLKAFAKFNGENDQERPQHPHPYHNRLFHRTRVVPNMFEIEIEGI